MHTQNIKHIEKEREKRRGREEHRQKFVSDVHLIF